MDWFYAVIYGIVEGITEFLPISSTGHLILAGNLMGVPWPQEVKNAFEVVIQGGAILAVLAYYWRDFLNVRHLRTDDTQRRLWLGVVVACLPALVIGLLFQDVIKANLFRPTVVAWALIVGGVLMWWIESRRVELRVHAIEEIGVKKAFLIGTLQCLALVWPGFSRSASSILGGMVMGLDRPTATKFSFYLGVPTLGGAALINLIQERALIFSEIGLLNVVLGAATSFAVAYLAIGWLLRFVSTNDFKGFAVYRIIVGVLILGLVATGRLTNGGL